MANKSPCSTDSPTEENENIEEAIKNLKDISTNITTSKDHKDSLNKESSLNTSEELKKKEKHTKNNTISYADVDSTKIIHNKEKIVGNKEAIDSSNENETVIIGENVEKTVVGKVTETNKQKENAPGSKEMLQAEKTIVSSEGNVPMKSQAAPTMSDENASDKLKEKLMKTIKKSAESENESAGSSFGNDSSKDEILDEKEDIPKVSKKLTNSSTNNVTSKIFKETIAKEDAKKAEALDKLTKDVVKISLTDNNEDRTEKNIVKAVEKDNALAKVLTDNTNNKAEGNNDNKETVDEKVPVSEEIKTSANGCNDDIKTCESNETELAIANGRAEVPEDKIKAEDNLANSTEIKNTPESNEDHSENNKSTNVKGDCLKTEKLESSSAYNPCLTDGEIDEQELNRLRGDAIGDTMYSERFVLSTLMKLHEMTSENLDAEFEKDLCSLWDMTTDEDVVKFLLNYSVFELFTPIIQDSNDYRLFEILIGITGNMCYFECAREDLVKRYDTMATILALVSYPDTPTLIQLMRLLATALDNKSPIESYKWFQHFRYASPNFVMSLGHILSNCLSNEVLSGALHALSVITSRFSMLVTDEFEEEPEVNGQSAENVVYDFSDIFVDSTLITSTMQGFQRIAANWALSPLDNETDGPYSQNTRRTTLNYLLIHTHICNCGSNSTDIYNEHREQFIATTNAILRPLSVSAGLLPLTQFQYDVVDQIYEFYMALEYPWNKECLKMLLIIWSIIRRKKKAYKQQQLPSNDFEDEALTEREMSSDFMLCVLRKFISYHLIHLSHKETKEIMADNNIDNLYTFMRDLDTNNAIEEQMTKVIDNYIAKSTSGNKKSKRAAT